MSERPDVITMFVAYIAHRRGALFHVTDKSNLPAIARHGLLSKAEAQARGVAPAYSGGDDLTRALDHKYGLWNYVFLGFTTGGVMPAHKEERHLRRPQTLAVDPRILHLPGVKIALGRANHRDTKVFSVPRAIQKMDGEAFELLLTGAYDATDIHMRRRINRVFDYEVLVPCTVPPALIGLAD